MSRCGRSEGRRREDGRYRGQIAHIVPERRPWTEEVAELEASTAYESVIGLLPEPHRSETSTWCTWRFAGRPSPVSRSSASPSRVATVPGTAPGSQSRGFDGMDGGKDGTLGHNGTVGWVTHW